MKGALLHDHEGLRTFVVVLDHGEDPVATLTAFAVEHRLGASHFTAIGAFSHAVVAYFDWSSKRYQHIPIDEQVEVLSMVGDSRSSATTRTCTRTSSSARRTRRRMAAISSRP